MENFKIKVAKAALEYIDDHTVIGIGTGTTVNHFIDLLATIKHRIDACVASSKASESRLRALGFSVIDLNVAVDLPIYFDSADEINSLGETIKGGGGALTREKVLASVASQFVCMVDSSKVVERLGQFPTAVEVIPLARSFVARELVKLGGDPQYRQGFVTDNGNIILDVFNLDLNNPQGMEHAINMIPGVLDNGIFAHRAADLVLISENAAIKTIRGRGPAII
ncbi:MAG: ribose-5-phosphate isomerase RpiA [Legionella sp.]